MLAVLSVLAAEGGEAKEVVNPVIPEVSEMVWGAIAFFLLLILMYSVCLPPLRQAMKRREDAIRGDQEAAERAVTEGEQVRRDYNATLAEARAEASRIVDEARQSAEAARAEGIRAAEDEAAALKQSALADLETQRATAINSLGTDVTTLAVNAASKVVQRPLDVGSNQGVVADHLAAAAARN